MQSRHVRFQFELFCVRASPPCPSYSSPVLPGKLVTKLRPITPYSFPSKTPSKTSLKTVFPSTSPSVNGDSDMPYVCSYRPLLRRTISVNPLAAPWPRGYVPLTGRAVPGGSGLAGI